MLLWDKNFAEGLSFFAKSGIMEMEKRKNGGMVCVLF